MPPVRWELTDWELKCACCRFGDVGLATGSRAECEFAFAIGLMPSLAETAVEVEEWEEVVYEAAPFEVAVGGALPVVLFALLLIVLMLELLPLALLDLLLVVVVVVVVVVLPVLRLPACNATATGEESEFEAVDVEGDDDEPAAI